VRYLSVAKSFNAFLEDEPLPVFQSIAYRKNGTRIVS